MAIKPIEIPSAAALEYGKGDVRHFAEGDDQSVPGLSNPTRQLADRDNKLAAKLNEVVETVNNREQFVPLIVPRTVLPPDDEVVVVNQRIPEGFEARVLSAAVAATPVSSDIELNVYYATGFGGSTGTTVVSTSSEAAAGTQFYQAGEFVVVLKNKGSIALELSASVLLTVRPVGAQGTLLVASVVQGPKGDTGPTGSPGPAGPPGPTTSGGQGMVWRGAWDSGATYAVNDVVSRASGALVSSYIALAGNGPSPAQKDPLTEASYWALLAQGSQGPAGDAGAAGSAANAPTFSAASLNGTIFTGASYVAGVYSDEYTAGAVTAANTKYTLPFQETAVIAAGGADGIGMLQMSLRTCFTGQGTVHFPQLFNSAKCDYNASSIHLLATSNGTANVQSGTYTSNGTVPMVIVTKHPAQTGYIVNVISDEPIPVSFLAVGAQSIV